MENLEINRQLATEIIEYIHDKGYAHNTIVVYRIGLKRLFKGHDILDKNLVMNYLKKYKEPNERAIIGVINQYCNQNNIDFNVIIPRVKQKPRKIPEILNIEEIKVMVQSAPKPYDLMLRCLFGIGAGLRISEALKFSWNNIRWIEWLNNKEYGVAVLKETKRDTERVVNIPNEIMEDLFQLGKERKILNEFGVPQGGLIFPIDDPMNYKKELRTNDIEKWKIEYLKHAYNWFRHNIITMCCEKALNKRLHVHMLRHSRATYLLEVEHIPIERIQQLLGHKDLKTTMIYTHVDPKSTFKMMKNTKVI